MNKLREDGQWAVDLDDNAEVVDALQEMMSEHEAGVNYKKNYYTRDTGDQDFELIVNAVHTLYPDGDVTVPRMAKVLELLITSGEIQPKDKEEEAPLEAPTVDLTPRDKNGKPLSASQVKWSEFRQFADSASMSEINLRKRSDPEFATFVRKNLEREFAEQPVGDAAVNLNANKERQNHGGVREDVKAFAIRYRTMAASDVKKLLSPGMNPDGAEAAARANWLFNEACRDGLI